MCAKEQFNEDGEKERYCAGCDEWWPADKEFFFTSGHGPRQLASQCKACYLEKKNAKRRAARELTRAGG